MHQGSSGYRILAIAFGIPISSQPSPELIRICVSYFARMDYTQSYYLALVCFHLHSADITFRSRMMYTDDADLRRLRRISCLKKFHLHDSRHPCFLKSHFRLMYAYTPRNPQIRNYLHPTYTPTF